MNPHYQIISTDFTTNVHSKFVLESFLTKFPLESYVKSRQYSCDFGNDRYNKSFPIYYKF